MFANSSLAQTAPIQTASSVQDSKHRRNNTQSLVFIDTSISDYETLLAGVVEGVKAHTIDPNQDGIRQITEILQQSQHLTTIHIVSHGSPGCLYLGNTQLNLDNLNNYAELLRRWQSNLSIFLYGCNVAAGDAGAEFIRKFHEITNATISASATKTGNAELGGDWNLEVSFPNNQETAFVFSEETLATYQGAFAKTLLFDNFNFENNQIDAINYTNLTNWTVTDGSVDLIGNQYFISPGNSAYLDLDGSTYNGGRLESKSTFNFNAGEQVTLSFLLSGSIKETNSVTVSLGNLFSETFTLPSYEPFTQITRTFNVFYPTSFYPTSAKLIFDQAGGDNIGLLLDDVNLSVNQAPTESTYQGVFAKTLLFDNFNFENNQIDTINYTNLTNWTVTDGSVDLIGNQYFISPGNSAYLDLDGSTYNGGRLESKSTFNFNAGEQVTLSFLLSGSIKETNSVTVSLGNLFSETFTLPSYQPFTQITRTFNVFYPTSAKLIFDQAGGDNIGLLLDDVNLSVNQNQAPTDLTVSSSNIAENQVIGSVVGFLSTNSGAVFGPTPPATFTYSLVSGTGYTSNNLFTIVGNQLQTNAVFNYEEQDSYTIRVRTTDQGGLSYEKQLTIRVTNVNETPTNLALYKYTIAENQVIGSVVSNFLTTDPDSNKIVVSPTPPAIFTYSLVSGTGDTDNNLFTIVDNQLKTNAVFNYEDQDSYTIRVRTEDKGGLSYEKQLTISVTNVNEAPTDLALNKYTIAENEVIGSVVSNFLTTDPDNRKFVVGPTPGDTFAYSLVSGTGDTDNSLFTIIGNQLKTNAVFDYEAKKSYSIRVSTTDQGGLSYEKQLTIGVTNVNKTPTDLALTNYTIAENQVTGSVVGSLNTTDPDDSGSVFGPTPSPTYIYSLVSGTGDTDNNLFTIVGNQLKTNAVFDYEAKNSYSVRVRTTDQGGLSYEKQLAINVTNVNEANVNNVPILVNQNFTVNEGSSIIVTNSMLRATDVDNSDAQLIYTLKALPVNGILQLNGINLAVNGTFSQDDINNSRLTYIHNGSETTNDSFNFVVSDGAITTTRISTASDGTQGNGNSSGSAISGNGRYVAFQSNATNLVSGDTNGRSDVFVKDLTTNTITLISTASNGTQGNGGSTFSSISADGRYVAFQSNATNLVSGDTNGSSDVFVKDLTTNTTTRISTASDGTQGNSLSYNPAISADGRYVVFESFATNLVSGDTNGRWDVFVKDLTTNTTTRISTASDGTQGNGSSGSPAISADGRYVVFYSVATNLVSGDTNYEVDVFVKDLTTNNTTRVSTASDGTQGNNLSYNATISADGRYVVFESYATNLVSGANNAPDVFVKDLTTNTTTRLSTASDGTQGNSYSFSPAISADGRYVVFESVANNLVSGDTNGTEDVFVKDLTTNTTALVSTASDGTQGNNVSYEPAISADGRYVVFSSEAFNLVSGDTNGESDVFLSTLPGVINGSASITITPVNDTPVITTTSGSLSYIENATTAIDSAIIISDVDSANLVSATVSITNGFISSQDILSFTNQNGITGNYDSNTGVLTLTGSSTVADYQNALASITYTNSSNNPSTTPRTISFQVNDGSLNSSVVTRNVSITPVNDAPILTNTIPDKTVIQGNIFNFTLPTNGFIDPDNDLLTYSASLSNNNPLPSWLNFNTATGTFSGTPTNSDVGTLSIKVTASDGILTASDNFDLGILPTVSINDISLNEGNSGTTNVEFIVTLSAASDRQISLTYNTVNGTAVALENDYTPSSSGTLTINPGETSGTITIPVITDSVFEPNETFSVALSNPVNAGIANAQGTATILNDDQPSTAITIANISQNEGNSDGTTNFNFTVKLSAATNQDVSVNYATADSTAIAGSDYTAQNGTLTILAGQSSGTIIIPVLADTTNETDEKFTLTLSNPVNSVFGNQSQATATIVNDDSSAPIKIIGSGTIQGGSGSDTLTGSSGSDILIGIDPTSPNPGYGEIDSLTGMAGADTFVLGSNTTAYYDDRIKTLGGRKDYALITDFNTTEDVLQVKSGLNYVIGASPTGIPSGTGIFIDNNGFSGLQSTDELIAVLQGITFNSTTTPGLITSRFVSV